MILNVFVLQTFALKWCLGDKRLLIPCNLKMYDIHYNNLPRFYLHTVLLPENIYLKRNQNLNTSIYCDEIKKNLCEMFI